jgi:hypothetical protein
VGKIVMGLRVVSDDGGPERFRQALFRALASVVEIWMLAGSPAVICSILSPKAKRIGDIFAGTVVVSERGPRLGPPPAMPPSLAWWASSLQLSGLNAGQAEVARQFLSRAPELDRRLRQQMAGATPPGHATNGAPDGGDALAITRSSVPRTPWLASTAASGRTVASTAGSPVAGAGITPTCSLAAAGTAYWRLLAAALIGASSRRSPP